MNTHNINYNTNKNTINCLLVIYFVSCIFFSINICYSQSITKHDTLTGNYKTTQLKKIDTLLTLYKEKSAYKYLNLLPNVSYNYNPVSNNNYVSVGINFNSFATYFQNRKRTKIELEKLKITLHENLNNKIINLENQHQKLTDDLESLKVEIQHFKIINKLYKLKSVQYENNKINLETWLKEQSIYTKNYLTIQKKIKQLKSKFKYYYKQIKSPNNVLELNILNNLSNQLKSFQP